MENGGLANRPRRPKKAFFILDNFPPVYHRHNDCPIVVLAQTYGRSVKLLLESNLKITGNLGRIIINMRERGYLEITPHLQVSWNTFSNSFLTVLNEVFCGDHVVQGGAIIWHSKNIDSLFQLYQEREEEELFGIFTPNPTVIGCFMGDAGDVNISELRECMDRWVHRNDTLVFVIGRFQNYTDLNQEIDHFVLVEGYQLNGRDYCEILLRECERKWNIT